MQTYISERAKSLKPSATFAISRKAKELKKQGFDILNLSIGEPDFETPKLIKESGITAINENFTKYTEARGIEALREVICSKFSKENRLSFEPEQIVVSNGAKHSLFNIMLALLNPGDEVIIPAPYWVSYPSMVAIAGGKPVFCKWNKEFKIDPDHFESLITEKTKAVILNSPNNPTGTVYTKQELERIAEIILKHKIMCISDEIYEHLVYDNILHVSIASLSGEMKKSTIVVNGVSKTFSMTGWRIGYIACEKEFAAAVSKIQGQTASNPCSFSQKAAICAIDTGKPLYEKMVEAFQKRRNFIIESFPKEIEYPMPMGAFYLFFRYADFKSEEFAERLLKEALVALVPGKDFGADRFVRMSFAVSLEVLQEAVRRISKFVKNT